MKNGNKKTCETILLKSIKTIQKSCKKSYKAILKLAVINSTSTFRTIQLKKKKRKKKKPSKEIPKFILTNFKRLSWALKLISQSSKKNTFKKLYSNLMHELITNSKNKNNTTKIDFHKQAIAQKRLFLYFRW